MPCLSKTARPQISVVSLPVSPAQTVSPFLQRCWTLSCPNLPASRSPLRRFQNQIAAHPIRRRCLPDMPKQKTIAELNAEKEKIEQQLTQEQHKKQRLENRIAYCERGDRTKRAHNLIVRSVDNSEVTALSIAGIRVPEMKKHPAFILCATSNSYPPALNQYQRRPNELRSYYSSPRFKSWHFWMARSWFCSAAFLYQCFAFSILTGVPIPSS